jgi:hypothetical protein
MAQAIVTQSMQAKASVLLSHADRWSRGTRRQTSEAFYLFSGSKGATYLTSECGCSCPSYRHRGCCSDVVAVQQHVAAEDERLGIASMAEIDCHLAGVSAVKQAAREALARWNSEAD